MPTGTGRNPDYIVKIPPNLLDVYGQTLGKDQVAKFTTTRAEPAIMTQGGSLIVLDPASAVCGCSVRFGALCRRDDLHIGEWALYRLVRIGEQVRHLSGEVAMALTLTHHRTLLAVADADQMQKLAQAAAQQAWAFSSRSPNPS